MYLTESPGRYPLVDVISSILLIIGDKVLDARGDACALDIVDVHARELAVEKGVLAESLKIATAERCSGNADCAFQLPGQLPMLVRASCS